MNTDTGSSPASQGWLGGLTSKIAAITTLLVAIGGLLDISVSLITKTKPLMCELPFPWCVQKQTVVPSPQLPNPHLESTFTPPTSFTVTVELSSGPGTPQHPSSRNWKLVSPKKWIESYIDGTGTQYSYNVIGRLTLAGCSGTQLREEWQPPQYIFITDIGCVGSPIYASSDGQHWGNIGVMTDMQERKRVGERRLLRQAPEEPALSDFEKRDFIQ
ncbi:MAG TPA: hypothetical protein VH206_06300 [Xanthobacteraceae bacterium]|jgi:hypothetical protein|nr:hypothetical protein [Xanthobacteraceae bacterium]